MTSIRKATALAGALAIVAGLAACGGPSSTAPAAPSSLSAAATPWTLAMRVTSDEEAARYETCNLFRQMVEGIDYLSTDEQQQLISEMANVVQNTGDSDLMLAVDDMDQGWLNSNPQQFARGMRALSQLCDVPYE